MILPKTEPIRICPCGGELEKNIFFNLDGTADVGYLCLGCCLEVRLTNLVSWEKTKQ